MSFNKDAKIHRLQEENDRLRRERTSYKLDKEAYKGTIDGLRKLWEEWEEVPDEDLWEDGELDSAQVQHKIIKHVLQVGDWRLIRRIEK